MTNPTTDPNLKSWIEVSPESDFPIQNLPYGVFCRDNGKIAIGVAIGDMILDLSVVFEAGLLSSIFSDGSENVFAQTELNYFMACGKDAWQQTRSRISQLLSATCDELQNNAELCKEALIRQQDVEMLLPIEVKSFADFYSSIEHATNVGIMFRGPENALMPNWKHLPVGYNGRASSVVVSNTEIIRPRGQQKADDAKVPSFGPSKLLDIELEMGFITGASNELGTPVSTDEAMDYIFGMVLLNDWSARDIQKWEYVPLGPFLGKSFATSISPWVVTMEALEPFRVAGPKQDPEVLPHLKFSGDWSYNIELEVHLQTSAMDTPERISKTNFRHMYWNQLQQVAHLTSNGTNIQVGDLYGSGTVSGTTPDSLGSLLELCWKGTRPLKLSSGEERKFLQDGDTIVLKGWCQAEGYRIGFGECKGKVLPALS